jgi:hypothetical protein
MEFQSFLTPSATAPLCIGETNADRVEAVLDAVNARPAEADRIPNPGHRWWHAQVAPLAGRLPFRLQLMRYGSVPVDP